MNVVLTESTGGTSAARRHRTPRELTPSETSGFDVLLAGLRPTAQPTLDRPVLIESEMFEAPQRQGGGRSQPRDDTGALSDQPQQSRTDVRARRIAAESPTRAAQQVDPAPVKSLPPRGTAEGAGESLPDQARREVEHETRPNRGSVEPTGRHAPGTPSKESTPVSRSDAPQPVATEHRVSAGTQAQPADTANSRAQSVAKTIGRMLGVPQSTGVETARGSGTEQGILNQGKTTAGKSSTSSQAATKQKSTRESSFARMVRSLRISPGSRNSSATIRLEPERLGRMKVSIKMSGDRISIEVRTETTQARELIASRAMDLRSALEQQGLQVERFDVRGDLAEADATDRPFGPKADDRSESGSPKRGSRRHAVESSSVVTGHAAAPHEGETVIGDETTASPDVDSAHRRRVDIRV